MINRGEQLRRRWHDWQKLATGPSFLFVFLFALSAPYAAIVCLRNILYDCGLLPSRRLACPVISVGNLAVGGTGKTPLVMMLAGMLQTVGYKPAIISRGYGRTAGAKIAVVSDGCNLLLSPREAGDEPYLMAKALPGVPVVVGACRFQAGKTALEQIGANILILDDAFQHRALYRDVNIVLLDAERPLGNGRLLPCGILRESPSSLRRADIVVMTGGSDPRGPELSFIGLGLPFEVPQLFHAAHQARAILDARGMELPLDLLRGKRVYAFAGIGKPLSFRRTIEGLGAIVTGFAIFADHHRFEASELALISEQAAQTGADIILTTEKDAVRLIEFPEFLQKLFLLRVEMSLAPADDGFFNAILNKLRTAR